ncbi:hypothetical protein E4K67_27375 [Desulfosporosinus fructosivorans]|uniref:Uncharacterized protein n=1 Tax=Desulfosporosinus fructosivorans TaxID=2018669 RepID=A0A4Z0QYL2_9FIRM|nr:hypothetical protein [Desulfosporosinus fructosivorans]TGE35033.1 hypothetical protein E4K67_27375 [Desulfosporosinus fructosivorans]
MPTWGPVVAAFLVPGSGYVILARPMRGLVMIFWMCIFGYITFRLSSANISLIGRFSGGIAVWVISVLEVHQLTRKKRTGQAHN